MLVCIHSRPWPLFKNFSLFIASLRVKCSSEYMSCHVPFCLCVYLFDPISWVLWRSIRCFRSDVWPLYSLPDVAFCKIYTQYGTLIYLKKRPNLVIGPLKNGSPARTRTADIVVNSHSLCQLSYWGTTWHKKKIQPRTVVNPPPADSPTELLGNNLAQEKDTTPHSG